jgi:ATP/maltotriose-dependent transcriptional regulator MalT
MSALQETLTPTTDLAAVFGRTPLGRRLTKREREVLALFAQGASNEATAHELHIAVDTVKRHGQNLRAKLAANNRTHAVAKMLVAVSWDDTGGGRFRLAAD